MQTELRGQVFISLPCFLLAPSQAAQASRHLVRGLSLCPHPAPRLGILPFCKVVTFTHPHRLLHSLCYCSLGNLCVADRGVLARSTLTTPSWRRRSYLHRGLSPPRPSRLSTSTSTSRRCSDRTELGVCHGEEVSGLFFLRHPETDKRAVNGCPRQGAIGWWQRSSRGG